MNANPNRQRRASEASKANVHAAILQSWLDWKHTKVDNDFIEKRKMFTACVLSDVSVTLPVIRGPGPSETAC